jgi:hypothetical protein
MDERSSKEIMKNMELSKKKKHRIKYEIMWAVIIIALIPIDELLAPFAGLFNGFKAFWLVAWPVFKCPEKRL